MNKKSLDIGVNTNCICDYWIAAAKNSGKHNEFFFVVNYKLKTEKVVNDILKMIKVKKILHRGVIVNGLDVNSGNMWVENVMGDYSWINFELNLSCPK